MRTIWRLLGDHRALAIAILALYITARVARRIQRSGGDERVLKVLIVVDAGLVAWAVWDEATRRRKT
ncbi:MAG: hypothetical protein WKF79_10025 [Nocardioides sp.]